MCARVDRQTCLDVTLPLVRMNLLDVATAVFLAHAAPIAGLRLWILLAGRMPGALAIRTDTELTMV